MATVNPIYHPSHAPLVESVKDSFRKHWKCNPTLDPSLKRRQAGETDYAGLVVAMMFDDCNPKFDVAIDGVEQSEIDDSTSSKDDTLPQENQNQSQDQDQDQEPPAKAPEPQTEETDPHESTDEEPLQLESVDVRNWERANGEKSMTTESFEMKVRRGMRNQPIITIREDNYPWSIDINECLKRYPFNQLWNHYVAPADKVVPDVVSVNVETCVLHLRQLYSQPLPEDEEGVELVQTSARDLRYSARSVLDTLSDADIWTHSRDGQVFRNWISTKSVDPLDLLETQEMNADLKDTRLSEHLVVLLLTLYDQLLALSYLAMEMQSAAKARLEALCASEPKGEDE